MVYNVTVCESLPWFKLYSCQKHIETGTKRLQLRIDKLDFLKWYVQKLPLATFWSLRDWIWRCPEQYQQCSIDTFNQVHAVAGILFFNCLRWANASLREFFFLNGFNDFLTFICWTKFQTFQFHCSCENRDFCKF